VDTTTEVSSEWRGVKAISVDVRFSCGAALSEHRPSSERSALSESPWGASQVLVRLREVFARRLAGSVRRRCGNGVSDAVSKPALIEKLELRTNVLWEGSLAAADDYRTQEQMDLVDQPRCDGEAGTLRTPDGDVGPRGLFELPDGVWIDLAFNPRPRTGYRLKLSGLHDLLG
jgi:hypothetical protein